jgi:hypothetical protein
MMIEAGDHLERHQFYKHDTLEVKSTCHFFQPEEKKINYSILYKAVLLNNVKIYKCNNKYLLNII